LKFERIQDAFNALSPEEKSKLQGATLDMNAGLPMLNIPTAAGMVRVPADRLLGNKDIINTAGEATLGNIDREAAERMNVLARLSGANPEVELGELEGRRTFLTDRVFSEVGGIQSRLNELDKQNPFRQSSNLATHVLTHRNAALGDFTRNPTQGALAQFLTPQQKQEATRLGNVITNASGKNRSATVSKAQADLRNLGYAAQENARKQLAFNERLQKEMADARTGALGGPGSGLVTTFTPTPGMAPGSMPGINEPVNMLFKSTLPRPA
jgi:hypothetical protein